MVKNLNSLGFKLLKVIPEQNIYKFSHVRNDFRGMSAVKANLKSSKLMVEIHWDSVSGPHMHITDRYGNLYDKNLNNLTAKIRRDNPDWHEDKAKGVARKLPEAHIKIQEFVELNMRPENV